LASLLSFNNGEARLREEEEACQQKEIHKEGARKKLKQQQQ
jgi:hypothetical protein